MAGVLRGLLVAGVAMLGLAAPTWADEVEDAAKRPRGGRRRRSVFTVTVNTI